MLAAGVQQGTTAPAFRLQNESGEWVTLDSFTENGPMLLVFYPGDFRMVCTKQLCAYQDALFSFKKVGVQVVGISANGPEEHKVFKEKYEFEFPLLSDPTRAVCKNYGVVSLFLLGGISRAVFIIGKDKKVIYRYIEPTPLSRRTPDELLRVIEDLKSKGKI